MQTDSIGVESLDTNVIVRLITHDIEDQYNQAVRLISNKNTLFVVDDTVISETAYVLKKEYKFTRQEIHDGILKVLQIPNFSCNYGVAEDSLNFYVKYPSWSFDDCYLIVKTALSQSLPLWTFDHKLAIQSHGIAREVIA